MEPGGSHCFRSDSNSNTLTHPARTHRRSATIRAEDDGDMGETVITEITHEIFDRMAMESPHLASLLSQSVIRKLGTVVTKQSKAIQVRRKRMDCTPKRWPWSPRIVA